MQNSHAETIKDNMKAFCFTGHRPNRLGGYNNIAAEMKVKAVIEEHIRSVIRSSLDEDFEFITGMAQGTDTLAGEVVASLRGKYPTRIKLVAAIPFVGQESAWANDGKIRYIKLLRECDEVVWVYDDGYAVWKMQKRNEWMVDRADEVIAVWNGENSGTGNCIEYANKANKKITNLWTHIRGEF